MLNLAMPPMLSRQDTRYSIATHIQRPLLQSESVCVCECECECAINSLHSQVSPRKHLKQ